MEYDDSVNRKYSVLTDDWYGTIFRVIKKEKKKKKRER